MIIPSNDQCRQAMKALEDEPNLSEWEYEFVTSNLRRSEFSDRQKEVIARLMEKYDIE